MDKVFIMVTDDDIDHMLYSETRDEIKRCNAEILRLQKLIASQQKRAADGLCPYCETPLSLNGCCANVECPA